MTLSYSIWIEFEEIGESCDHYRTAAAPGAAVATFAAHEQAYAFVEYANALRSEASIHFPQPSINSNHKGITHDVYVYL